MTSRMGMNVLLMAALAMAGSARANTYEDPERIRAAAFELLSQDNPAAQPGDVALDDRLRLPACGDTPLSAAWVREGTVEIGCPTVGWKLFVPIRTNIRTSVLALTRSIAAVRFLRAEGVS